jgi:hypothetical protein
VLNNIYSLWIFIQREFFFRPNPNKKSLLILKIYSSKTGKKSYMTHCAGDKSQGRYPKNKIPFGFFITK